MPISLSSAEEYGYRCYISTALTYGPMVKSAQLACQGYYADLHDLMEAESNNSGFVERNNLMRKGNASGAQYKSTGTRFFGRHVNITIISFNDKVLQMLLLARAQILVQTKHRRFFGETFFHETESRPRPL